jgi:cell filamentation protein, protein adenylyltransferase
MRPEDFMENAPGDVVTIPRFKTRADLLDTSPESLARPEYVHAFIPHPLPPKLEYTDEIVSLVGAAMHQLGELERVVKDLPKPSVLVRPFVRREAVASSQIEGTIATIDDLVDFAEAGEFRGESASDVQEVENYVKALDYGLRYVHERDISEFLVRELHQILLTGTRGSHLHPGEVRNIQNYIGNPGDWIEHARYVPPPPEHVQNLLLDLTYFISAPSSMAPLIRIALVHYQFEAIHPFLDGNGRVGRLLNTLLLVKWGVLTHPVVDISAYLLANRESYIGHLGRVSHEGTWSSWIDFFLEAASRHAQNALRRSKRLIALREDYLQQLSRETKSTTTGQYVDHLFEHLAVTNKTTVELLGVTPTTAQRMIGRLVAQGTLEEATGRKRDRVYRAREIIAVLDGRE